MKRILQEASAAYSLVADWPYGQQLVKDLHTKLGASHLIKFGPAGRSSDISNIGHGVYILIKGSKGTAVFARKGNSYLGFAYPGGIKISPYTLNSTLESLRTHIGKITKVYISEYDQGRGKKINIVNIRSVLEAEIEKFARKYEHRFKKYALQSLMDMKEVAGNAIKAGNFKKASLILSRMEMLHQSLEKEQVHDYMTDDGNRKWRTLVNVGLSMAAHHYYPEETVQNMSNAVNVRNLQGVLNLLDDIKNGNTDKLMGALYYIKLAMLKHSLY